MKKKAFIIIMLLVATISLSLAGCSRSDRSTEIRTEPVEAPRQAAPPAQPVQPAIMEQTAPNVVSRIYPCGSCGILRLDKRMPESVAINAPFTYTIKVTNETGAEVAEVVVKEHMAENFKVLETNPKAEADGKTLVWALGSMEPESSKTLAVRGVPTAASPVMHCATMTYVVPACAVTNVVEPQLVLAKSLPSEVLLCDTIPMKIQVRNSGTGVAKNVVIQDELPANLTGTDGKRKLTFNAGTLAAGQSREFTTTLKATRTGKYENVATASSAEGLSAKSAPVTVTVRQPVLAITKTGPAKRYMRRPITYQITVTNKGDASAQNLVVTDAIPSGLTFVSADNNGAVRDGKVVWTLPTLAPSQSRAVKVTFRATRGGTYTNQAVAQASCADPVRASAKTSVSGIAAILLEVIDVEDPIEVGGNETYIITTTNQGSSDGSNIRIVCTLEDNMEYVSSNGPTQASVQDRTITFAPLTRLAPKAKATWKVIVKAVKPDDARFKVTLNSGQLRRPVEETESTHIYE
jgi:uncharacterized repeat protein (TIGR01451 family)/fimbrial isopeptide formation D2 family protein